MAERLTDEQMALVEKAARDGFAHTSPWAVEEAILRLLTEVRERRAQEKADDAALAELDAIGEMSVEECNRELEAAGVDTALWASSTNALIRACTERNAAMARIAELEACLRECVENHDATHAEDCGAERTADEDVERDPEINGPACDCGMLAARDRARAALSKGESK